MDDERRLANLIFGENPLQKIESENQQLFQMTNRKQFRLFYERLVRRLQERLDCQFGGSLGLIQEKYSYPSEVVAKDFLISKEYRGVREDLSERDRLLGKDNDLERFEFAFLNFVARTYPDPAFLQEFSGIYLQELALQEN